VYHLKAYRKRKLVYRGYRLHPHPTVQRDLLSWLPEIGPEDQSGRFDGLVERALDAFAAR